MYVTTDVPIPLIIYVSKAMIQSIPKSQLFIFFYIINTVRFVYISIA